MISIYIAAHDQPRALALRKQLSEYEPLKDHIQFQSSWMDKPNQTGYGKAKSPEEYAEAATADLEDVFEADLLILLSDGDGTQSPGGKHTELGFALALEIPVVVFGPPENVFHHHPAVRRTSTFEELVHHIGDHVMWREADDQALDEMLENDYDPAWDD